MVVPKDKLKITGSPKKYSSKGSSGQLVHRLFCGECGSPIAHDPDAAPEIIALKGGTLSNEDKQKLKPVSSGMISPPRHGWSHPICNAATDMSIHYRIPKSGQSESCLSAKKTSPSLSSTCPSKSATDDQLISAMPSAWSCGMHGFRILQ